MSQILHSQNTGETYFENVVYFHHISQQIGPQKLTIGLCERINYYNYYNLKKMLYSSQIFHSKGERPCFSCYCTSVVFLQTQFYDLREFVPYHMVQMKSLTRIRTVSHQMRAASSSQRPKLGSLTKPGCAIIRIVWYIERILFTPFRCPGQTIVMMTEDSSHAMWKNAKRRFPLTEGFL